MSSLASLRSVRKIYQGGEQEIPALKGIDLDVERGEFICLMGPSGCGKSTLLHVLGGMDRPCAGEVWLEGKPLHRFGEEELTSIRRNRVGFVFQFFYLLPTMTVEENVELPLLLSGRASSDRSRIRELLARVGLSHRLRALPSRLSGGEMQRTAIARALVAQPVLLLADEPTGNLDSENGTNVLEILRRLCREEGTAVVMATHNEAGAGYADRVVWMKDGRLNPLSP